MVEYLLIQIMQSQAWEVLILLNKKSVAFLAANLKFTLRKKHPSFRTSLTDLCGLLSCYVIKKKVFLFLTAVLVDFLKKPTFFNI